MAPRPLTRIRALCAKLPETHEVEAWGEPTFRVRNKLFAMYASADNHHGGGRGAVWIKAAPENQRLLIASNPSRYFKPPYVGPSGWIGVWLDDNPEWNEIAELLHDAYCRTAPKRLLALLPAR